MAEFHKSGSVEPFLWNCAATAARINRFAVYSADIIIHIVLLFRNLLPPTLLPLRPTRPALPQKKPDGFPPSSDVANMSVLGGDLATELCGRGPLEAASQGIAMGPDDVVFRLNLVTVAPDGTLKDFSGGHVGEAEQKEAIALLNAQIADGWKGHAGEYIRFYPGVSYRNLVLLHGPAFSGSAVAYDKPDDNSGNPVAEHLPRAKMPEGEYTAQVLRDIIARAAEVLKGRGANGVWPWSGGKAGAIHSVSARYGIRGAIVAAVANTLSKLIAEAARLREEHDLTI